MPNGSAVRRARVHFSRCAGSIRAGGAESADIPRSDRERVEGFHLSRPSAVAVSLAVAVTTASERVEGVHLTAETTGAVTAAGAVTETHRPHD